ncbi:hypothetical protein TRIATDRAFT_298196 [Trichoderma atroviride IMI 206040]|uniref:Uncharacterized protein n=1 Tax=Hypocrea atroviridis (strain ATCC 20476 / IMI 206040) TaxID=452589 RepID=G9NM20_HYPAI|nr:uncharacterized protein TRIATDRAFT_298196 [Trichoderma atroviride IMI 206040]EHK47954.1 hypothetical protein TRIATDRAFT_298196 [Trichoderma atroviride IMI 206040]
MANVDTRINSVESVLKNIQQTISQMQEDHNGMKENIDRLGSMATPHVPSHHAVPTPVYTFVPVPTHEFALSFVARLVE